MKLTGKVTRYNESVYGAKVYITDSKNSYIDKDRVGRTDPDGKFSIPAPIINENGVDIIDTSKYIAFESYSPQGKGIKQLEKGITEYTFDTEKFPTTQELQEFTVSVTKPATTPKPIITKSPPTTTKSEPTPPKSNKHWWVLPSIVGLLCLGGITYLVIKNRKK
jgi:hypothetical protein